jgi:hypothetical protein
LEKVSAISFCANAPNQFRPAHTELALYRFHFLARSFCKKVTKMAFSRTHMHNLLLRAAPGISAAHHTSILDAMDGEGLFGSNGGPIRAAANGERTLLSPMRAAAAARHEQTIRDLKSIAARCARAGYAIDFERDDKPLNVYQLDSAFKACGKADHVETMAIKSLLARLGMLA